jgi:hypothetical protein
MFAADIAAELFVRQKIATCPLLPSATPLSASICVAVEDSSLVEV